MLLRPRKDEEENLEKDRTPPPGKDAKQSGKDRLGNRLIINDEVVRASCTKFSKFPSKRHYRQSSISSFVDERSEVGENVTNLVSVLPAIPHCKPNHPVHPHFKPKSGLVDSAEGI